jgi:hypothetical protein
MHVLSVAEAVEHRLIQEERVAVAVEFPLD